MPDGGRPVSLMAAPQELEPLTSAPLRRRFPQLATALDGELMRGHLQGLLLEDTGMVAQACARPRAEVHGDVCWLQYPLRVDGGPDGCRELLVLGAMFADPDGAARYERVALAAPSARWSARRVCGPRPCGVLPSLRVAVSSFPVNGPLPTVVDATDERRMCAVLRDLLAPAGDTAELTGIDLVGFRRSGGCVLRYRLAPTGGPSTVYGKIGYGVADGLVRDTLLALGARRVSPAERPILYPQVLAHAADLDLVLSAGVPGVRPDLRDEMALDAAVEAAALAAATMHTSGVRTGGRHTFGNELGRARRAVGRIGGDAPELAAWLSSVLDALAVLAPRLPASPPVLAHGDLTPSQLLLDGSRIGIVDFDGLCQAEPAFDLGRFLAYLRVALAKSGSARGDALASRFLATYQAVGGDPVTEMRAEIYGIASLVQMAAHCWRELKPARLRLACAVLEEQVGRL